MKTFIANRSRRQLFWIILPLVMSAFILRYGDLNHAGPIRQAIHELAAGQ